MKRLPGRRSDDDELGRNCRIVSHDMDTTLAILWSDITVHTLGPMYGATAACLCCGQEVDKGAVADSGEGWATL